MSVEISCIIPAYENLDLFARCLASVCAQSEVAVEIIVSDDSRTDAVRTFTLALAAAYPSIRHIAGPRSGNPVDNWNHGLDAAHAPVALLVHHDEFLIDPLFLRRAVDAMQRGPVAVMGHTAVIGMRRASRFGLVSAVFRRWSGRIWWLPLFNWIGPTAALVFRTPMRFDPALVQLVDIDFYLRVLAKGDLTILDGLCVGSLGHHGASITSRIDPDAAARLDLATLAARTPPAIGGWQRRICLSCLAARSWLRQWR